MTHESFVIDTRSCGDLSAGRHLEWLVTNGRGGFAMGTVNQMLTRRYHGLLVAAVHPPVERFVLLAKLDVTVTLSGLTYELATNDYHEAVHPNGYRLLESFAVRPFPTWRWRAGEALIEQTLCMAEGEDTTFVRYRLIEGPPQVVLTVRPLCTSRHFHHLSHYQEIGPPNVDSVGSMLSFHWPGGRPAWSLAHNGEFRPRPDWYYSFQLAVEQERGYDTEQDLFMPGVIAMTLDCGDPTGLVFAASTQQRGWETADSAFAAAASRDEPSFGIGDSDDPLPAPLLRGATDFCAHRGADLETCIAGYPWFGDWGRDTFISLPGLCLVTGRFEAARRVFLAFAGHVDQGMIPNRFPDYGEAPVYDTADATLWYIHVLNRYLAYTGDWDFIADKMMSVVTEMIEAHERGTRHGIRLCDDGLLAAGEPGFALTWMDARVSDCAITPRIGKPVEINALWYNALRIGADFAQRFGDDERSRRWSRIADRACERFNTRFWNESAGCLFDVVDVEGEQGRVDDALRPNQLFALSLSHPILDESHRRSVVDACEGNLWTPMGLRTLSPGDPHYCGRYQGDVIERDRAYHQGTVWPWLLGPFVTAYLRAYGDETAVRNRARSFLDGLVPHLSVAGLGGISEVADGDAPHAPGGCPWQAWSLAEPLRALCEDILCTHPAPSRETSVAERVTSAGVHDTIGGC